MSKIIIVELALYFMVMIGIGVYFGRKKHTQEDFMLGGGKLPGWALAFSERAACESVYLLMGATGFAYATGVSSAWLFIGSAMGTMGFWLFFGERIRKDNENYKALTLTDYLAMKFGAKANLIRWFISINLCIFFMFYLGAQFSGAGKVFLSVAGLDPFYGMILAAVIILVYAFLGGFTSIVWADVVQSILMVGTLVVLPIVAFIVIQMRGLDVSDAVVAAGPGMASLSGGATGMAAFLLVFANLNWAFTFYGGQPQLTSRVMAMRDLKEYRYTRNIALAWIAAAYTGAFCIGILGLPLYGANAFKDAEILLPHMIQDLFHPAIAGILIASIMAAMMSTAASVIMVVAGTISEDVIHKALNKDLSSSQLVLLTRVVIVAAGLVGVCIALTSKDLIYYIVSWMSAGVGSTISAVVCLGLFYKKASARGIAWSILFGTVFTILWMVSPLEMTLSARFMSFFVTFCFGILVSHLCPDSKYETKKTDSQLAINTNSL